MTDQERDAGFNPLSIDWVVAATWGLIVLGSVTLVAFVVAIFCPRCF